MLDTATRKEMLQKMVIVRALREDRGALPKKRDVWQHPLVSGSGRRLCRGCLCGVTPELRHRYHDVFLIGGALAKALIPRVDVVESRPLHRQVEPAISPNA
jgi:hypothetical protein